MPIPHSSLGAPGTPVSPRPLVTAGQASIHPQAMLILSALILSTVSIMVRFSDVGAAASAFWRVLISALAVSIVIGWRNCREKVPRNRGDAGLLVLSGFFFAGDLVLLHVAIRETSVANATLLNNLAAPMAGAIASLMGRHQGRVFWIGGAIALAGATILAGTGQPTATSLNGILCGLVSAVFFAGYLLVSAELRGRYGLSTILQWGGFATAFFLLPVVLLEPGHAIPASLSGWTAVVGLGLVIQCCGQGLLIKALARVSGPRAGLTVLLAPVFAMFMAAWVFAEPIGPGVMLGATIILAGILISSVPVGKGSSASGLTACRTTTND